MFAVKGETLRQSEFAKQLEERAYTLDLKVIDYFYFSLKNFVCCEQMVMGLDQNCNKMEKGQIFINILLCLKTLETS